jgi:hypothetical protein
MVIYDLTPDEQDTAEIAWALACKEYPCRGESNSILISSETDDGYLPNYRMQSFIREWAACGYTPAQTLISRIAMGRLNE